MIALNKTFTHYQGAIYPSHLVVFSNGLLPTAGVVVDVSDMDETEAMAIVSELTTNAMMTFADDADSYQAFLSSDLSVVDFPIHHVPVQMLKVLDIEKGDVQKYVKLVDELNEALHNIIKIRDSFYATLDA